MMKKLLAFLLVSLFPGGVLAAGLTIDSAATNTDISAVSGSISWSGSHVFEGLVDVGTQEQFTDTDADPDVSTGIYWSTFTNALTITDFDGTPVDGQVLIVESLGAITWDCTGAGLDCGTVDIVTAAGDVTTWVYDGTDWDLISFMDVSTDMGTDAGASGLSAGDTIPAADGTVSLPGLTFNSDTDSGLFRVGANHIALGTNAATAISILPAGEVLMPLQPSFLTHAATQADDRTGDGTVYTVDFPTEIYDQGGDFDGLNTFTAPITGRYHFCSNVFTGGYNGTHSYPRIRFITSNRTYTMWQDNTTATSGIEIGRGGCTHADMDAADTMTVAFNVNGSTQIIDIHGSSTFFTWFSGELAN